MKVLGCVLPDVLIKLWTVLVIVRTIRIVDWLECRVSNQHDVVALGNDLQHSGKKFRGPESFCCFSVASVVSCEVLAVHVTIKQHRGTVLVADVLKTRGAVNDQCLTIMLAITETSHGRHAAVVAGVATASRNIFMSKQRFKLHDRDVCWNQITFLIQIDALLTTGCNEHRFRELCCQCSLPHTGRTVQHQEATMLRFGVDQVLEDVLG